ncbi:MAG: signal recognition particle-docking protein FtsY [Clostridia bacterium]|nr:signal recognition particle-docking protein FtsY [Clostridia bacterium]
MGFFDKLKQGLAKTREAVFGNLFSSAEKIDDAFFDELEEGLILADVGMETTEELLEELRNACKREHINTRPEAKQKLISIVADHMRPERPFAAENGKAVLLIVGVNGVGKTTSIGKLAHVYKQSGRAPMLAAADTFRAAAAEQLAEWAERAGVPMVRHQEGSDPAAVVFDSVASYKAKNCDLLIVDTAGRLHNKQHLMDELSKIGRVISRELPDTPCEVLLVLDATTGQNAVAQARAFKDSVPLSGVILTKLDGTAKGGVVIAIANELRVPVRFVGVGEKQDDLQRFDPDEFAAALF